MFVWLITPVPCYTYSKTVTPCIQSPIYSPWISVSFWYLLPIMHISSCKKKFIWKIQCVKVKRPHFKNLEKTLGTDIFLCFIIFPFITISMSYSIICVPYLYIFVCIIFSILVFYFFSLFSTSSSSSHSSSKSVLVNILK